MASNPPGKCCTVGTLHEGEPAGKRIKVNGNIDAYLATPPEGKGHKDAAILYIPDVIGLYGNAFLMADQYAANGYTTLILDLFYGDPVPLNRPGDFSLPEWIKHGSDGKNPHNQEAIDPLISIGIKALKDLGFTKIGAVGYCFGAKYLVRHYKDGIQVGFVAHPSFVTDEELAAITGPLSIAAAEVDSIFPANLRYKSEEILAKTGQPWQINLYSGTQHGFSVRGDPKVKKEKFAKEQAFAQAVAWFDEHLL
ncbi:Fc.00g114940.m01.CDS01 [Cosmosporella sp. VM-42]